MTTRRGFSLLEVIVALSILAIIATLTFTTISGALQTRDTLEREDEVNQTARVAIDRIRRDLELAWLTTEVSAVNTFHTVFVARNESPDVAVFTTLAHHRLYRESRECDQTEVTLWTEPDPDRRDALVLMHREAPRIDGEPDKDGVILPLAYNVKAFELRFLDGQAVEWKDEWDTTGGDTPNRLPRAAQVVLTLWAPDPDDDERQVARTFATTILLTYAEPLQRNVLDGGDQG